MFGDDNQPSSSHDPVYTAYCPKSTEIVKSEIPDTIA